MKRIEKAVLIAMALSAFITSDPGPAKGAGPDAGPPRDPVKFSEPTFVDPPMELLGDAGDGRCPDPSKVCLKDVDDLLFGRTHILRSDDIVFGYQGAFGLFTSQDSTLTRSNDKLFSLNDGTNRYSQPAVVGARLFNTAADVAVILVEDRNTSLLQWRLDSSAGTVAAGTVRMDGWTNDPSRPEFDADPGSFLSVVADDFTGDGFDEIVVFLTAEGANGSAIVGTAVDPQDPSQGLKFGPLEVFIGPVPGDPFLNPNHIAPLKVTKATVLGQPRVFVAGPTNYPAGNCPTLHSGLSFEVYRIDPQTLAISSSVGTFVGAFAANLPEGNGACLHSVDITAGRFTTPLHDQLLVTYGLEGGNVKVLPFDLNDQGAVQQPIYDTGIIVGGEGLGFAAGASIGAALWIRQRCSSRITWETQRLTPCAS